LSKQSCKELKSLLKASVDRNYADALLLSGGLDSSILACVSKPSLSLTISLGQNAPDVEYAKIVAGMYTKRHKLIKLSYKSLLEVIEKVIRIFKTFDPMEIRNSTVLLSGISAAQHHGIRKLMTGDGGDELFAGYNYLKRYYMDVSSLDYQLHKLWDSMHFSSLIIGNAIGVKIKTPFLDKEFLTYAKSIDTSEKIGEYSGEKWGKFILRRCYESELGKQIAWRSKLAQEQGAGITKIKVFISEKMDDRVFHLGARQALSDGVKIRDKEHLYYYIIFRKFFSAPKNESCPYRRCPECNGCFNSITQFCRICGAFPVVSKP
jgi:asparagine synthase (glutamine-hydrolysing)